MPVRDWVRVATRREMSLSAGSDLDQYQEENLLGAVICFFVPECVSRHSIYEGENSADLILFIFSLMPVYFDKGTV